MIKFITQPGCKTSTCLPKLFLATVKNVCGKQSSKSQAFIITTNT